MPFNPDKITKADVLKAVEIIERDGYDLRTSTGYDVIINGKPYPPKEIMRYAHEVATGEFMWNLGGGEPTNKYLKRLGFEIGEKKETGGSPASPTFTWIPAYKAISKRLLQYENKQPELIAILQSIGVTNFNDQDTNGRIQLSEIDPLSFLCYLNKYGDEKRLQLLRALCEKWEITPLPEDVKGLPNVNALKVWLFPYKKDRTNNEIQRLWTFYKALLSDSVNNQLFEDLLKIFGIGKPKLTEVMFMVSPDKHLCLNGIVKPFLQSYTIPTDFGLYQEYLNRIEFAKTKLNKSFPVISHEAYLKTSAVDTDVEIQTTVQEIPETYSTKKETAMGALNTILYGPPGTGKTYHSINKSVAIANPQFAIATASREQLKAEYERLVKDGQIEFITFHQSMSYEDFIEGIKPVEPKEDDEFLKYEIKDGIFKRLCEKASKVPEAKQTGFSIADEEFQKASFYKMSLGDTSNPDDDQIYEWCINNGYIAIGRGDANDFTALSETDIQQMVPGQLEKFSAQALNYFIHYAKVGDYVIVSYGNLQFRAIGKITGNYEFKNIEGLQVHQFRKVEWLWTGVELPYEEIYDRQFSQQSIYKLDKRGLKKDFLVKTGNAVPVHNKVKNYVLIIDEINRGNVSQIFGELITLIEEDKRAGKEEALTITLPYSKKAFSVPPNLYIIGTMNTADRSVEALDTALRRRFSFAEMQPDPEILSPYCLLQRLWMKHWLAEPESEEWKQWVIEEQKFIAFSGMVHDEPKYIALANKYEKEGKEAEWMAADAEELFAGIVSFKDGVNLAELLKKINSRLKILVTKDHIIGHAWLMNVFCLEDLQTAFRDKIIPLLQEFFYNDYAKIGLVLGDQFIEPKPVKTDLFAKFKGSEELAGDYTDKIIYELKDIAEIDLKDFKSI